MFEVVWWFVGVAGANITRPQAESFLAEVDAQPLNASRLHDVARRVFRAAGCRVISEYRGANDTPVAIPDLVVWHDSLDFAHGSPIVVEVLARTDATGAMLPRLRATRRASGARTMLALSSGGHAPRVDTDTDGSLIIETSFKSLVEQLRVNDLNLALSGLVRLASQH